MHFKQERASAVRGAKGHKSTNGSPEPSSQKDNQSHNKEKVLGAIGGAFLVVSTIFFSTGHVVIGIITGFIAVIAAFATLAEFVAQVWASKPTWTAYWMLMLGATIGCALWIGSILSPQDVLLPADEPNPPSKLDTLTNRPYTNHAFLFMAGTAYGIAGTNRISIITAAGRSLLSIELRQDKAYLSGEFFGRNGDVVAVLENNRIISNPDNVLSADRPDKSTLRIRDKQNNEVLNVRHINSKSFTLTCNLRLPDSRQVVLTKDRIHVGNSIMEGNSFSGLGMIPGQNLFTF